MAETKKANQKEARRRPSNSEIFSFIRTLFVSGVAWRAVDIEAAIGAATYLTLTRLIRQKLKNYSIVFQIGFDSTVAVGLIYLIAKDMQETIDFVEGIYESLNMPKFTYELPASLLRSSPELLIYAIVFVMLISPSLVRVVREYKSRDTKKSQDNSI